MLHYVGYIHHIMQDKRIPRKSPPLLPIFRSRSLVLLLAHLFNRSGEGPLNISELARRLDLAVSTVTRDVAQLEQAGLLSAETIGRSKIIRVNDASPYHEELESLFQKAFGPEHVLTELLEEVDGIEEAYLYGSWAARYLGEPGLQPEDVDLLVVSDGSLEIARINRIAREASQLLGREVNPVVVTREEWAESKSGFLRTVRRRPLLPLGLAADA